MQIPKRDNFDFLKELSLQKKLSEILSSRKQHIYTVSELTLRIKEQIEEAFLDVWVEGEVSNLREPQSGHIYFRLKDAFSVLECVLFQSNISSALKFKLENGLHIIAHGRVSIYEGKSVYQLIVDAIEVAGRGALQLAFEQLKEKLRAEGLFAPEHKKPLPLLPQRIGLITSPTGAALRDILKILNRRFANLEIYIYPVLVQGEEAAVQIANAIDEFNALPLNLDVLILARGGGSLEDLWPFNEEIVARSIYRSKIPIISAIGHETDYTISDFVADSRAPTPSAAAELVVKNKEDLEKRINDLKKLLSQYLKNVFDRKKEKLIRLISSPAISRPMDRINNYYQTIDEELQQLNLLINHKIELTKERLHKQIARLEALSPLSILARGYSIVYKLPERKIIKESSQVSVNNVVEIQLHRGKLIGKITKISNDKDTKKTNKINNKDDASDWLFSMH